MKGCLVHNPSAQPCVPASTSLPKRPPNVKRKSVSFCGSSQAEEQERVEVYVADDWDRTPCEVASKLTYQDILELYELKLSVPRASPSKAGYDPKLPTLLKGVPVGLLPLLADDKSTSGSPVSANTRTGSTPTSGTQHSSSRTPNPPNKFLPLMPIEDEHEPTNSSPFSSHPPSSAPNSRLKNFQFLPIYPVEPQTPELDNSPQDQDSDHTLPSPTSTPSLTSSANSSPSTPSVSPSPKDTPSSSATPAYDSYFDLPRQSTSSVRQVDLSQMHRVGRSSLEGAAASARMQYPSSRKLTLKAVPSPNLLPPSPFDLQGSISQGQYLQERKQQQQDKLKDGEFGRRKSPSRRYFYTGGDDDVDEPFFSFEKQERARASPVSPARRPSGQLRSPSPVLVPFCKME